MQSRDLHTDSSCAPGQPVPAAQGPPGRVPDFFIVGQPKCGTTALHQALMRHPEIYMPRAKEPNFFSGEGQRSDGPPDTWDDYIALFSTARPSQRIGEASVFYLSSQTAARAIADVQPEARVIAILREPAALLHSLHLQFVQSDFEPERSLRKALLLESERREGRHLPRAAGTWQRRLFYSDQIRYVEQLSRYAAFFRPEQTLVVIYDDLRRDNHAVLHAVLRFVGVDDAEPIAIEEVNPTVRVRSRYLNHITFREESVSWRGITGLAKAAMPARLRTAARESWPRLIYGAAPSLSQQLETELRRHFKHEVVALSEYLKRDLVKLWGYDRLD